MNSIYRSVWSESSGTFIAVSENSKGAGKKKSAGISGGSGGFNPLSDSGFFSGFFSGFSLKVLALSCLLIGVEAQAQTTGGVVVSGNANISQTGVNTTITQSTPKLILNWDSFNIAKGETVQFNQPGTSSVALNRVVGSDSSQIFGNLFSNGKVFLVNPNGILFGKGASVNVGGFVASTADISNRDFNDGNMTFTKSSSRFDNASVINQGTISTNADGAYVALLGAHVQNEGIISAKLGSVALASGNQFTLDLAGDGLLQIHVDQAALSALVENQGILQADGGQVILSARSASTILQNVVNNTGLIQARSIDNKNGLIRLLGNNGDLNTGIVTVAGTLDASGELPRQTGGQIDILASHIDLSGTRIQVNGDAGGGKVQVGRNFSDIGSTLNSLTTVLSDSTIINADAMHTGNGGDVRIWSDANTTVAGTLSARGGAISGDGGFIETSGKNVKLTDSTNINTLAASGKTGVWLLDPVNWVIAGAGGDETPASVIASLAGTDRIIDATNDITVASAVTWLTGQKLQLDAGHDVLINAAMTASTDGSAIVLNAGNDVKVTAAMTASAINSKITMTAGNDILVTAALTTSAANAKIDLNAQHNVSIVTATADGGGSILVRANNDVTIAGTVSVDTGSVTLYADNDGTGPGLAGGTVNFVGPSTISAVNTIIRFNPANYADTTTDIANYLTRVVAGAMDAKAWVFVQGGNKVYDGNNIATLAFKGTPTDGGIVSLVPGTATYNNKNVANGKVITYNGYSVAGADAGKFSLFAPFGGVTGVGTTTGNITPRGLVVAAAGTNRIYNGLTPDTVSLSDNRIAGDVLATSYASANFIDPNVGVAKVVNVAGINVSGLDAGNYSFNTTAVTAANITVAPLSITANDATKNYGETPTLSTAAFSSAGLVNGETILSVTETSAATLASAGVIGSPYAITPSAATGGTFTPSNYAISYNNGSFTVAPASLVITANNASKNYGQAVGFSLTAFTSSGLVNGETVVSVNESSAGAAATANVNGSPYAITPSGASGSFTPSNYALSYVDGALSVLPIPLTVTADNASKNYGQTMVLPTTAFTTSGLVNGDTVVNVNEVSAGTIATANVVGSPYTITPSGATGTFIPSNYTLSYVNGALAVLPIPLVVTANDATKNYGQAITLPLTAFTSSGLVNGDTVVSVNEASAGTAATANVSGSPYAITPSGATGTFTPSNYTLSYVNGALAVTAIPLVVTANDATKNYGQAITLPLTAFTSTGLVNGDTVVSVTETSPGTAASASIAGNPYAITPSSASGSFTPSNYSITYVNGALTIQSIPLVVTANDLTKNYGQAVTLPLTAFTTSGLVNGDTIVSVNESSAGTAATANVIGSPYAIVPSGASGSFTPSNYTLSYVNGALTVLPIPLTVTANNASKNYGQTMTLPTTAFTTSGLVNSDTVVSVNEVSAGTVATANVIGSPYAITPSGASGTFIASNYTVNYVNGALTVLPIPLVVTANDATKSYGQAITLPLTAFTSSGLVNGDTVVSVTETSPGTLATASVAGNPYAITPSSASGSFTPSNYSITYVNGALTIQSIPLIVTANDLTKNYGQAVTLPLTAFTSSGLVNGDTIVSVIESSAGTAATANVIGSPYAIVPSGASGSFTPSNYSLSYVNGALTVLPIPLTVTANNASKNYGQTMTLPTTAFTTSGLVNSDTVVSVNEVSPGTVATANVIGSPYAITPSGASGTFIASNYTVNYVNGALTVLPVPLVVTANDATKNYGQSITLPLTAFTSTGLVNGDTVVSVTETSPGTIATASVIGSPYSITPSGATGTFTPSNYTLSYVNGALTVLPIPLVVTANNAAKNYGQTITLPLTAFTSSGLVNGDTIVSVNESSPGTVATASVIGSPYAITPSGASGSFTPSNYTLSYVNGALTVLPIPLVVKANDATKNYGQTITLPLTAFTSSGLVNGDTVTSVNESSAGTVATANVNGSPYTIVPSGASGSFTPSNYTLSYINGALTVLPIPLTVTANNASKNYGQTIVLPTTAFTTTGLVNSDTVVSVNELSPGTVATASVVGSPYVITPSGATGSFIPSNYIVNYINGALTVLPVPLVVTANDATKNYGQTITLPLTAFTSSGLVNGDTVVSVNETSPGTVATASVTGSPYAITPSAATGTFTPSNYILSYVNGALTVLPIPLTVKANNASKNYGQTITLPLTAFTASGLVNGDTVVSVNESSPGTVATASVIGSPYAITPSGATGSFTPSNYTVVYVNGELKVIPTALNITASDVTKPYGTAIELTEYKQTGLVNGETIGNVNLTSPGTPAAASVIDSPYVITASNASGGTFTPTNYNITYTPGELTVTPPVTVIPPVVITPNIPLVPLNPDTVPLEIITPEVPTGLNSLLVPEEPKPVLEPKTPVVVVPVEKPVKPILTPVVEKPVPRSKKAPERPRKQDRH
ncbi:MBG domain-containing protein [Undibacterium sp. Ji22W]|uniref:MBG domain-containing protein n=1 Tax=Undibacterium sp. Ji22W TaxID=3413038 RepID=UPI003BF35DB0